MVTKSFRVYDAIYHDYWNDDKDIKYENCMLLILQDIKSGVQISLILNEDNIRKIANLEGDIKSKQMIDMVSAFKQYEEVINIELPDNKSFTAQNIIEYMEVVNKVESVVFQNAKSFTILDSNYCEYWQDDNGLTYTNCILLKVQDTFSNKVIQIALESSNFKSVDKLEGEERTRMLEQIALAFKERKHPLIIEIPETLVTDYIKDNIKEELNKEVETQNNKFINRRKKKV